MLVSPEMIASTTIETAFTKGLFMRKKTTSIEKLDYLEISISSAHFLLTVGAIVVTGYGMILALSIIA